jgi:Zn-dependent M16 (insulinase) family peptidase
MSAYLNAFFALPVNRESGERLTHEEVVNKLDDETVSYEASLGFSGIFTELFRASIKVEKARYEEAIAWLKDLLYGAQFNKERLQVTVAKIQQTLPELKRDGNTILSAVSAQQLYDKTSTSTAGAILEQMEFVPKLAKQLQEEPDAVIAKFEKIRKLSTRPHLISLVLQSNASQ